MLDDSTYIWPFVGIVIGWLLNEFSFYFRKNREDKRTVRSIVYILFELKFRLEQMEPILKDASKSNLSDSDNRTMILKLLKNEKDQFSYLIKDLKSSIQIISSFNPFIALELNVAIDESVFFNTFYEFDNSITLDRFLELEIKKCNKYSIYLKHIIKKLLWKTDKIYLIKFIYQNY